MSDTYVTQSFRIISYVKTWFQPIDVVCQFEYKGHLISISTAGSSQGACHTKVEIFKGPDFDQIIDPGFRTVEEAINFINYISGQ